jgi:hypothetical protein
MREDDVDAEIVEADRALLSRRLVIAVRILIGRDGIYRDWFSGEAFARS